MSAPKTDNVSNSRGHVVLGAQLRKARETVEFRPEEVAERLAVTPEEVLQWEAGRAKPGLSKLERLAALYGREIDYFLRETPSPPARIQFRSGTGRPFAELSAEARLVIARFDELCRTFFELERTLDKIQAVAIRHVPKGLSPGEVAYEQRRDLGLGERPVRNLRDLLAQKGIRIFELVVPPHQFSGFSYWHPDYGPCMLINAKDPPGRRNFTVAHEYAHLLYSHAPSACDISEEGRPGVSGEERSADIFAIEFLLPTVPVREDFSTRGLSRRPSLQQVGTMAGRWRVSVQAMLYRLEDLSLLEQGYASYLLASYQPAPGRIRAPKVPRWERRLGRSFVSNAIEAYERGHISLGKLAHCLGLPIRKALEAAERSKKAH